MKRAKDHAKHCQSIGAVANAAIAAIKSAASTAVDPTFINTAACAEFFAICRMTRKGMQDYADNASGGQELDPLSDLEGYHNPTTTYGMDIDHGPYIGHELGEYIFYTYPMKPDVISISYEGGQL
jgi:hypothetical protein